MDFEDWLYESHDEEELRRWATRLRYFRFCRAYGGHANDGDCFLAALRFESEPELVQLCGALGVNLNALRHDEPQPEPGRRYTAEQFARFRSRIPGLPQWEQPGMRVVESVPVMLWARSGQLQLRLAGASGDDYAVTQDDFQHALALEPLLAPMAERLVDPPQDDRHCVCPRYHARLWDAHE